MSIEKVSQLALLVCFTHLLHSELLFGLGTNKIALELFQQFYRDHDNFYEGLQNFALHLHIHFSTMYDNHGVLLNIGCFGQEDLIGSIESNHHGTKYYGELITYDYNIDCSLHSKSTKITKFIEKIDSINNSDQYHNLHAELCGCEQLRKCFSIYRRFVIKRQIFHSLLHKKCGKSISYFVQYLLAQCYCHFGTIECFSSLQSKGKSYALINMYRVKQK